MKIGIVGAPGVGKSDFARELRDELAGPKRSHRWHQWVTLDNYVEDLRLSTGLEYGNFGNLLDDLQVVFKRREWELHWQQPDMHTSTITVGTVLDSTVHNFIRAEDPARNRHEVGLYTQRLQSIAHTFGLIYTESWDYDYAFYLPSDDLIGRGLRDLIVSWHAPVFTFNPEVPDDEKASVAAETIRTLEAESTPETDERGVRSGGEPGEEDGDSAEPVPDVPESRGTPDDA